MSKNWKIYAVLASKRKLICHYDIAPYPEHKLGFKRDIWIPTCVGMTAATWFYPQ